MVMRNNLLFQLNFSDVIMVTQNPAYTNSPFLMLALLRHKT
ncbi:hypothetical protein MIDIC_470045 [Alphaproteobacteria bacterium]